MTATTERSELSTASAEGPAQGSSPARRRGLRRARVAHGTAKSPNRHAGAQRAIAVWGRIALTGLALIAQLVAFIGLIIWSDTAFRWVGVAATVLSVGVVAWLITTRMQIEYKLAWAIVILLFPLLGGAFYLLYGSRAGSVRQRARLLLIQADAQASQNDAPCALPARADDPGTVEQVRRREELYRSDPGIGHQLEYFGAMGPFVAYYGTETTYYPVGDDVFPAMLEAMEAAEHYIAAEYFIVSAGAMWDQMADVMMRKAKAGVTVYFMYDDLGSIWHLPRNLKELKAAGVQVQPINKFGPGLSLRYNNRDHRKMLVVDSVVAFTGGINIADEYINQLERFGHWRDTSIRLRGAGVWGMVALYFTFWDMVTGQVTDPEKLRPEPAAIEPWSNEPGVVVAYDDTPLDDISVGWAAYRNLIVRANHTIDFTTPYLVPTADQLDALRAAAQGGVRVRMVTPGIPDKPYVYAVTRSNYRTLIEAGVEIYEYTPGFMHAKQMVVDGKQAIIGTINFDFRSFYLHQENAVWMTGTPAIQAMSDDFDEIIAKSRRVSIEDVINVPWWRRAIATALRTFSPML